MKCRGNPNLVALAAIAGLASLPACAAEEPAASVASDTTAALADAPAAVGETPAAQAAENEPETVDPAEGGLAPAATARWRVSALGPEPLEYRPTEGLPLGRVGVDPRIVALVPEATALAMEPRPMLYWYLPEPSKQGVVLTLHDRDTKETVFGKQFFGPLRAGFHGARTARLERDHTYEWVVRFEGETASGSGGVLRREPYDAALQKAVVSASAEERLRLLARSGHWYDAFGAVSRSIERRPKDERLLRARAELLEQAGLGEVVAADAATAP